MIYILGSINCDLVVFTQKFARPKETINGLEFVMNQGGKGANQAVAVAKSNVEHIFIGRIGNDSFGSFVEEELKKFKVDFKLFKDNNKHTGVAFILVERISGENSIIVISGANSTAGEEELKFLEKNFTENDILLIQGELPVEVNFEAAKIAKSRNGTIIFDPAPVKPEFSKLFPFVDFLTPNELEIVELTNVNDIEKAIKLLLKTKINNILLKLGAKGVRLINNRKDQFFTGFKVDKVVDTTGAGDTFNGYFASSIAKNFKLEESILFAQAAAALSVTRKGAAMSIPYWNEVLEFIKSLNKEN